MNVPAYSKSILSKAELLASVVNASKELLNCPIASEAKNYLQTRLSNYNIDRYNFGFIPNDQNIEVLFEKIDKDILLKLGLIYKWDVQDRAQFITTFKGHFNNHNIVFPYYDEYGNLVALAGRTLLSSEEQKKNNISKYKYSKGFLKPFYLYGLNHAKKAILKSGKAIVVEGQLDAITCHANGFHNVVALGGTSFAKYQLQLLMKSADEICLLLDNDEPGRKAERKIMQRFSDKINVKKIHIPSKYKDVDEYLRSGNCDALTC